jgi:hypothetical protein
MPPVLPLLLHNTIASFSLSANLIPLLATGLYRRDMSNMETQRLILLSVKP